MSFDVSFLSLLADELSEELQNAKIEKIQQPERDLILIHFRKRKDLSPSKRNEKLLIRISGGNSRVHLTENDYENPKEPPMFCMLLRKHLNDAVLQSVSLLGEDRILQFHFSARSDLGDLNLKYLVIELTGRTANAVLCDQDYHIIDCLHRNSLSEFGKRALLPGLIYVLPPKPDSMKQNKPESFSFSTETWGSCSRYLDLIFREKEREELRVRHSQSLLKPVRRLRDRQERKLALQKAELEETNSMEMIRRKAELLTVNLYRLKKGDSSLTCEDYYSEDGSFVTIPLDPIKTPQQNAAKLYKDYRKMKGAKEHLTHLIQEGENKLDYLNSVLDEIKRAENEKDLQEIEKELFISGILKETNKNRRTKTQRPEPLLHFHTDDGLSILVGKNNIQNDMLTFQVARRTDYWFHVKNHHGSHVILQCEGQHPSEQSIYYAASLAVRYSEANASGKTAVDYTMVRNVKKPSGAMPGRVIYDEYRTVLVDQKE